MANIRFRPLSANKLRDGLLLRLGGSLVRFSAFWDGDGNYYVRNGSGQWWCARG